MLCFYVNMHITLEPPKEWDKGNLFFDSAEWQGILHHAFDSHTLYMNSNTYNICTTITVFSFGFFQIAYFHFPVGLPSLCCDDIENFKHQLSEVISDSQIHLLRCSVSALSSPKFKPPKNAIYHQETVIHDLQIWDVCNLSKRARRDAYRAQREGFICKVASEASDVAFVYQIYKETIQRWHGKLKYNQKYFQALIASGQTSDHVVTLLAERHGVQAFMTIVIDQGIAFYLHGGHMHGKASMYAGDFLMLKGIQWAQEKHATHFNMLASPQEQTGLIRYKEKWGGVTSDQWTIDIPAASLKGMILQCLMSTYSWLYKHHS